MPDEIYEIISLAARYWFALLGLLIVWRSFSWLRKDRRAKHRRLRQLPDAGMIGELVVLHGSDELPEGTAIPVPREGVLGFVRTCDVVVPVEGVARQHIDFTFQDGKGGMKTKSNKIGFVAAMQTPEVIGGFDAFALGVQSVNPDAVVYVKYTNSWYDPTLERQTADALLDMGCDVIAQHCDTANPQIAAQERGVWGCGYNADMSVDAPAAHLTAPVWNWGAVYTKETQAVIDGTWVPENIFLDMSDGLVDLSPLSENCAGGTAEAIEAARAKILSGEFDVFNQELWDNQGNQLTDANGCFVADIAGTSAKAGEPITRAFVAGELTFVVKGVEVQ